MRVSGECGLWLTGIESRAVVGRTSSGINYSESQEVSQGLLKGSCGPSTTEKIVCAGEMLRAFNRL